MDDIRPSIPSSPTRLPDQLRRHMRDGGYAWKTGKTYVHRIRQKLPVHSEVATTDIDTHVPGRGAMGGISPLDGR